MTNYFDAQIFEKVLEYVFLPSKGFQRCNFLFPEIAPLLEAHIKAEKEDIQWILYEEMDYRESVGYVREGEKAKEKWFAQLREDFQLPLDYVFES